MMMMTTMGMIVEMMTVMHTGGVAVASDATFPAQLVVWPDLAGLAYLCASNTSTPNTWPLTAQLVGWPDLVGQISIAASIFCQILQIKSGCCTEVLNQYKYMKCNFEISSVNMII